jgi:hypothetical protein
MTIRPLELAALDTWLFMSESGQIAQAMQWRAKIGNSLRAYSNASDAPSVQWQRLECIQSLKGPDAGQAVNFHYVVEADVSPENDQQLNAWYEDEHLPGLASVPGTIRAARYRRINSSLGLPKYYACYDLVSLDVTKTESWLAVRHTAWSDIVRPMFLNTVRTEFVRA